MNIPLRWRSFQIMDHEGNCFGAGQPRLEYFNGVEWEKVPHVCTHNEPEPEPEAEARGNAPSP